MARDLRSHALVVEVVAIGNVGHGRRGVDVGAIGGDGVDSWDHNLNRSGLVIVRILRL